MSDVGTREEWLVADRRDDYGPESIMASADGPDSRIHAAAEELWPCA